MQKIDAHSHVGYFGGWADVGYTDEQMVAEMDQYGIEKSVVSYMDNTVVEQAVKVSPIVLWGLRGPIPTKGTRLSKRSSAKSGSTVFRGLSCILFSMPLRLMTPWCIL